MGRTGDGPVVGLDDGAKFADGCTDGALEEVVSILGSTEVRVDAAASETSAVDTEKVTDWIGPSLPSPNLELKACAVIV